MTSTRKVPVPVAGSRIWTKGSSGDVPAGIFRPGLPLPAFSGRRGGNFCHLAPGGGVGEAVFEAELGLQEFVDAADDVGDDRLGRVEDAALDLLLLVVLLEESLVEVDDRVFFGLAVAEVAEDGLHVGLAEGLHHVVDAQLVEIDLPLRGRRRSGRSHAARAERDW